VKQNCSYFLVAIESIHCIFAILFLIPGYYVILWLILLYIFIPLQGFTGWMRLRLSEASMPNHGEKKAPDFLGLSGTTHLASTFNYYQRRRGKGVKEGGEEGGGG
jgi:hypothetical protein